MIESAVTKHTDMMSYIFEDSLKLADLFLRSDATSRSIGAKLQSSAFVAFKHPSDRNIILDRFISQIANTELAATCNSALAELHGLVKRYCEDVRPFRDRLMRLREKLFLMETEQLRVIMDVYAMLDVSTTKAGKVEVQSAAHIHLRKQLSTPSQAAHRAGVHACISLLTQIGARVPSHGDGGNSGMVGSDAIEQFEQTWKNVSQRCQSWMRTIDLSTSSHFSFVCSRLLLHCSAVLSDLACPRECQPRSCTLRRAGGGHHMRLHAPQDHRFRTRVSRCSHADAPAVLLSLMVNPGVPFVVLV
jgi:hypothetical protein